MDFSNLRGNKKGGKKDSASKSSRGGGANSGASHGKDEVAKIDKAKSRGPKNITETKGWQQSTSGLKQMWGNYVAILAEQFRRLDRPNQEQLITRLCQVVTVGCAIVLTNFFYQFIPLMIRVFAFPAILLGSWWVASKVVAPIVISQFEDKLNK